MNINQFRFLSDSNSFKYSIIQTEVICLEWEEYQTRIVGGIKPVPVIRSRKEMVCADGNWDYGQ